MVVNQPNVLQTANQLLGKAQWDIVRGKRFIRWSVFFTLIGVLLIGVVVLNLPLMNGNPIYDIDEELIPILLLCGVVMNIIAMITALKGKKYCNEAYWALYTRSEYYRQAPFMVTTV